MNTLQENRYSLAKLYKGVGVEVGVADGWFSKIILANDHVDRLVGVDPYMPLVGYWDYRRRATFEGMESHMQAAVKPFGDRFELMRMTSEVAVNEFIDDSLDFVFIDANHGLEYAFFDIVAWTRKIKPGGVVSGHDYVRLKIKDETDSERRFGVVGAVQLYCQYYKRDYTVWRGERHPSWSFIK